MKLSQVLNVLNSPHTLLDSNGEEIAYSAFLNAWGSSGKTYDDTELEEAEVLEVYTSSKEEIIYIMIDA